MLPSLFCSVMALFGPVPDTYDLRACYIFSGPVVMLPYDLFGTGPVFGPGPVPVTVLLLLFGPCYFVVSFYRTCYLFSALTCSWS
jgi:hypothetical protein